MFNDKNCLHINKIKSIAEHFDIKTPRIVQDKIFKQGIKQLDNFYNDYYLNPNNFIRSLNYYITFFFKNNRTICYKL